MSVEHLFMCLLAIWMSSLEKCPFMSSVNNVALSTGAQIFLNLFLFSLGKYPGVELLDHIFLVLIF